MKYKAKGKITHTVELTGADIMGMMSEIGTRYTPGSDATIKFRVPGGGDYSNVSIDFKDEPRVIVTWHTTRDEDEE